jgi:hypothetical protein
MDDLPIEAAIWRGRALVWLQRYLPPELAGTSAALVAALALAGDGAADAVLAASWAEAAGFYGVATARELRLQRTRRAPAAAVARSLREVVTEFGIAEAADTILLRPLAMYAAAALLGTLLAGVIVGKLLADVAFYCLAIPAYELRVRAGR